MPRTKRKSPYDKAFDPMKKKDLERLLCNMQACLSQLTAATRRAYQTAVEIVPELVQQETPLIHFLRTEKHDAAAAAQRIALYWQYRRTIFGNDRWLLPMTQTGTGALTPQEIAFVRSGFFFTLPCQQGQLIIVDHSKALPVFEQARQEKWNVAIVFERIGLYFATVATNPMVQTTGATLLYPINSEKRPVLEFRLDQWEKLRTALPYKISRVVVAQAYEPHYQAWLDFARLQISEIARYNSGLQPVQVQATSCAAVLQQLEALGLTRQVLPTALGGDMVHETQVAAWTRAQLNLEEASMPRLFLVSGTASSLWNTNHASLLQQEQQPQQRQQPPPAPPPPKCATRKLAPCFLHMQTTTNDTTITDNDATATMVRRQRNALYSRRMYHKRKLQTLALQQQIDVLRQQQAVLRAQYDAWQRLLVQARACIDKHVSENTTSKTKSHDVGDTMDIICKST